MELIISVGFNNGQVTAKCETFEEANAARHWLNTQGILPALAGAVKPGPDVSDNEARAAAEQAVHEAELAAELAAAKPAPKPRATKPKAAPAEEITTSINDVTKAVTDYAAAQGPTEARALFSRFGVTRGGDLKPEQFAEFVAVARDYTARGIKATDAQLPEGSETAENLM